MVSTFSDYMFFIALHVIGCVSGLYFKVVIFLIFSTYNTYGLVWIDN